MFEADFELKMQKSGEIIVLGMQIYHAIISTLKPCFNLVFFDNELPETLPSRMFVEEYVRPKDL